MLKKEEPRKNRKTGYVTEKLAVTGALAALDVVFSRLLAINTPVMKIGFGFLAVALCGSLYGPLWGAVCGAIGDLTGAVFFPTGAYFPGFTLTAAASGAIFGLFLKAERRTETNFVEINSADINSEKSERCDYSGNAHDPVHTKPTIAGVSDKLCSRPGHNARAGHNNVNAGLNASYNIRCLAAAVLNTVLVSYFGNTLMISFITDTAYGKLLAARAVQLAVTLPLQSMVLLTMLPLILSRSGVFRHRAK